MIDMVKYNRLRIIIHLRIYVSMKYWEIRTQELSPESKQTIKIRKYNSTLMTAGVWTSYFAAWVIIRALLFMMEPANSSILEDWPEEVPIYVFWIILLLISIAGTLMRLKISRSALREAQEQRISPFYLYLTAYEMILSAFSFYSNVADLVHRESTDILLSLTITLFETGTFLILADLFIAALCIRRYKARARITVSTNS